MRHATCNMQRPTCDMRNATCDMRHVTYMQRTCDMRHASGGVGGTSRAICTKWNVERGWGRRGGARFGCGGAAERREARGVGMRHATCDMRHAMYDVRATC